MRKSENKLWQKLKLREKTRQSAENKQTFHEKLKLRKLSENLVKKLKINKLLMLREN